MRIGNSGHSQLYTPTVTRQPSQAKFETSGTVGSTGSVGAPSTGSDSGQVDFSHMTRQGMFDWMNDQIKSGKMTFDESTPFLSMTMAVPVSGNDLQDASFSTESVDFLSKTQQGISGAQSRGDQHEAQMLVDALNTMLKSQPHGSLVNYKA